MVKFNHLRTRGTLLKWATPPTVCEADVFTDLTPCGCVQVCTFLDLDQVHVFTKETWVATCVVQSHTASTWHWWDQHLRKSDSGFKCNLQQNFQAPLTFFVCSESLIRTQRRHSNHEEFYGKSDLSLDLYLQQMFGLKWTIRPRETYAG